MNWLSQNWMWIALAVGIAWWLMRGGLAGHGERHGHQDGAGGLLGGLGGHHRHGAHRGGRDDRRSPTQVGTPGEAVDPIGGETVRTSQALTSVYRGRIHYFASRQNRHRFEAAPDEFAQQAAGHPLRAADAMSRRTRRRHGC